MKGLFLIPILFFSCCSPMPVRKLAATDRALRLGLVDSKTSSVKQFPPEVSGEVIKHFFYLQLKNAKNEFIDCDPSEIVLQDEKDQFLTYTFERKLPGHYYLIIESLSSLESQELKISVQKQLISEHLALLMKKVHPKFSTISLLKKDRHELRLQLNLKDIIGKPVEIPTLPEIIMDGQVELRDLIHVREGVWEFTVVLPEENIITYISVRAHGILLPDLFRFHHVEL